MVLLILAGPNGISVGGALLHCTKIRVHHRDLQQGPAQILAGSAKNLGDSAIHGRLTGPERVTSAKVDIWSTDDTQARERFSYWRDAVCRAVFNISIEATRGTAGRALDRRRGDRVSAPAASWCDPGGESPAQVRGSARLVASVAWPPATVVAKRTQRLHGVWD